MEQVINLGKIPEKYKFSVRYLITDSTILTYIRKYFKTNDINEYNVALLTSGEHKFNYIFDDIDEIFEVSLFAYNQQKQGFIILYFESEEEYKNLLKYFTINIINGMFQIVLLMRI